MGKEKHEIKETETQIVSIYLCQMLGCPTVKQIAEVMSDKMDIKTNKIRITNSLNSAKKRGILSVNHIQNDKTGEVEDGYSMKDVRFANPPEIAHIKNVLPKLLEDEGTKEIYEVMEGEHEAGKRKGGRLPDIRDYVTLDVTFKNILPVLGGKPFSSGNGKAVVDGTEVNAQNSHRRIGNKIWIPGNLWLRASIRDELRVYNIPEAKALYMKIDDYFFTPEQKLVQEICSSPSQRKGGTGTGLTSYEALQPGELFKFRIKFPTTQGIPLDIMKQVLNSGIRIGARHKDYGLLETIEIKNGEVK